MGGYGSGGWNYNGRPVLEECRFLSVAILRKNGVLNKGAVGTIRWGASTFSFETRWADMIVINWRIDGDEKVYEQFIGIQWLAHRRYFGGAQTYLLCGRCHAVRTKLIFLQNRFFCRRCHRIPYASQRLRENDRLRVRLETEARRLESVFEWGSWFIPPRPKGMRIATYRRIVAAYQGLLVRYKHSDARQVARILGSQCNGKLGGSTF